MAGFEVITYGRFWVIAEVHGIQLSFPRTAGIFYIAYIPNAFTAVPCEYRRYWRYSRGTNTVRWVSLLCSTV